MLDKIGQWIISAGDALCGYPEFLLLIGGGLFFFIYSGGVSLRRLPWAVRALRDRQAQDSGKTTGQISSVQALLSAIAATVGMGNSHLNRRPGCHLLDVGECDSGHVNQVFRGCLVDNVQGT